MYILGVICGYLDYYRDAMGDFLSMLNPTV